jgi:hypothetical protein
VLGSGNPTPYDVPLFIVLVALAILLLIGAGTAPSWTPATAVVVRRAAVLLGIVATAVVLIVTPTTNGIIGAGRVLFIWPALGVTILGYLIWSWRSGGL